MAIVAAPIKGSEGADLVDMLGGLFTLVFTLAFSGNYVAGGEVISAPTLKTIMKRVGAGQLFYVNIPDRIGYTFEYDYVNDKVLVRQGLTANPDAEIPAAAYPAPLVALSGNARARGVAYGR